MAEVHTKAVACAVPAHIFGDIVKKSYVVEYVVPTDKLLAPKADDTFSDFASAQTAVTNWIATVDAAPIKTG